MAWSPYNVPPNTSGTPGQDQGSRDAYHPYGSAAHQYPPSLATEPSTFPENHLPYNIPMQHPSAPVNPNYHIPFLMIRTDFDSANHNTVHNPSIESNRPGELSPLSYLSSGPSTACTTPSGSGSSTPAMQEMPQSGIGGHEMQTIYGATRTLRPRHDELHETYQCNWKDCKYRGVFSRKGVLMRHIETQHVSPYSIGCPVCGKLFSRRDNMTEHLGRIHSQRL
ncbi:hypothetical protein N7455_008065 [Penicillium solitum]|uniref:uncharacterized protein n=1 Tax=Penicillium solitum TaxID=60172 RepID=UPI00180AEA0F|nr:hypothetical protein HAV15_004513 [Penicillium sp. str. \